MRCTLCIFLLLALLAVTPTPCVAEEEDHHDEDHHDDHDHGEEEDHHDEHGDEDHHDEHGDEEDGHDDHDHHAHGHHPWEWSGVFTLEKGETYTWTFVKKEGKYAADDLADMKLVIAPADAATQAGLEASEELAEPIWDQAANAWTEKHSGDLLQAKAAAAVGFKLEFDQSTWISSYRLRVPTTGAYTISTEHMPFEFEDTFHFLKDDHGDDVEPGAEEPAGSEEEEEEENRLGLALGGAALTATPGLVMIAVVGPMVQRLPSSIFPVMHSLASGAIFACAVFLLLPEGLYMAGSGHSESVGSAYWGTAIMLGWLLGVVIHHCVTITTVLMGKKESGEPAQLEVAAVNPDEAPQEPNSAMTKAAKVDLSVCLPVLLGDFCHNFVDGMVIGFTAKVCGVDALWTIVGATIGHEAPQEVADFIILVTKGGLSWPKATLLNFLTALPSAVLGALISYEVETSQNVEGVALAFGAGVYLYVALTELGGAVVHLGQGSRLDSVRSSLLRLFAFAVGAVAIGLVLINHEHCVAESSDGEADPHAGHHH